MLTISRIFISFQLLGITSSVVIHSGNLPKMGPGKPLLSFLTSTDFKTPDSHNIGKSAIPLDGLSFVLSCSRMQPSSLIWSIFRSQMRPATSARRLLSVEQGIPLNSRLSGAHQLYKLSCDIGEGSSDF